MDKMKDRDTFTATENESIEKKNDTKTLTANDNHE